MTTNCEFIRIPSGECGEYSDEHMTNGDGGPDDSDDHGGSDENGDDSAKAPNFHVPCDLDFDDGLDDLGYQGGFTQDIRFNWDGFEVDSPSNLSPTHDPKQPNASTRNQNLIDPQTSSLTNNKTKASKLPPVRKKQKRWSHKNNLPNQPIPFEGIQADGYGVLYTEEADEDRPVADLFTENVGRGLLESVNNNLSGPRIKILPLQPHHFEVAEDADDVVVPNDIDLDEDSAEEGSLVGSDDELEKYGTFNPNVDFKKPIELKLGLKFPSRDVLRKAIRYHAVKGGYDYYFLHNNLDSITAYCRFRCNCEWKASKRVRCTCKLIRKCNFKIHARKMRLEETFQIRGLRLVHTCGFQNANAKASSEFLAETFLDEFRDDPKMSIETFRNKVRRKFGIEVGYYKAYYARIMALDYIHGTSAEQYHRVWDYAAAIQKYNPGSSAFVRVSDIERPPVLFQRMYIFLQPCKEGFMQGCRHILGVDGCHLRGLFLGICLVAVGKDGNNNLFPVAWAVVEVENKDTWRWFLELLKNDLGSVADHVTWVHEKEDLTFMSDRQKGLLDAFSKVVPDAEIRYYCRHIWANFKLTYPGEAFRVCFWKAARASTKDYFEQQMESIKFLSKNAFNLLDKIPSKHWSRHSFTTKSKSAMILNNCCESFNNVLREARVQPILSLIEWIRRYVMKRCCEKKEGLEKYQGNIMPAAMKQLVVAQEYAKNCFETKSDVDKFEVIHGDDQYVVDLKERTCGCFRWDLTGIPCCHAFKCIMRNRADPEDYVHQAYSREAYSLTYSPIFYPMPGIKHWEKTQFPQPEPLPYKKMPGRPSKKKRTKELGEGQPENTCNLVVKKRKPTKCSNCQTYGHNKKRCRNNPAPPPLPKKKGRPVKKGTFKGEKKANKQQSRGHELQEVSTSQAPQSSQLVD